MVKSILEGKSRKAFIVVSNNPQLYYDWIDFNVVDGLEEDYQKACKNANKQFVKSLDSKHNDLSPELNGAISVFEISEDNTYHIHSYFCSKNAIRFDVLQKKFPHSHIEPALGSVSENILYFKKEGKHKKKAHTSLCEPVYWGNTSEEQILKGDSGYFAKINQKLVDGYTPRELFQEDTKNAQYSKAITVAYVSRHIDSVPDYQDVYVEYHVGESRTGKSYVYKLLCDEKNSKNIHKILGNQKHKWDNYDFVNHSILFIDNLEPDSFKHHEELLTLLDNYKCELDARYENKVKNWNRVIITSVFPPEEIYLPKTKNDSAIQFLKRINKYVYHFVDGTYPVSNTLHFRTFELMAEDYVSYEDLKEKAKEDFERRKSWF